MADLVSEAATDRLTGEEPGRLRAIAVAVVVGIGAAVAAYRLLRG